MTAIEPDKKLKYIKAQIEALKNRLESIDKTLSLQEKLIDLISTEPHKQLLNKPAFCKEESNSVEKIMKKAFSKGSLPKILFK